jgi:aspartate/methionine/tyrosine aminotransferase
MEPEKLRTLAQIARDYKSYVIVDEVYLDASTRDDLRPAVQCGANMISISSLTKSYGLGNLRLGWVVTQNEPVAQKIRTIVQQYIMGSEHIPSHSIGVQVLGRLDALRKKIRAGIETNLKILSGWISRHGDFKWVKPEGGTVCFVKLPSGIDDMRLSEMLQTDYDTLVSPGHFFWKKGFIRIAFGCDADILRSGLRNIQAAVDKMRGR